MAVTVNNVNEELIRFRKKAIWSFLRESRFDAYTGTGNNNIIQRVIDLEANGKQVNIRNRSPTGPSWIDTAAYPPSGCDDPATPLAATVVVA